MTDLFKEMIKYTRDDFEKLIQERSKSIKMINICNRIEDKKEDKDSSK